VLSCGGGVFEGGGRIARRLGEGEGACEEKEERDREATHTNLQGFPSTGSCVHQDSTPAEWEVQWAGRERLIQTSCCMSVFSLTRFPCITRQADHFGYNLVSESGPGVKVLRFAITTIKPPPIHHDFTSIHHVVTTRKPQEFPQIPQKPLKNTTQKIIFPHATELPAAPATPPSKSSPAPPSDHTEPDDKQPLSPPSHTPQTPPSSHNLWAAPPPPD